MPITGENRMVAIATPLGEDKVVITAMKGSEHISELFNYQVSLLSEDHNINADDLLGENVTIRLENEKENSRYFNGFVTAFTQLPSSDTFAYYQIEVQPWLWFLTKKADCRIFQNVTVPDLIKDVLGGHGFDDVVLQLTGDYRSWEYCVQYRETDFNFVSRLMEQEGIYYFFKHSNGKHELILGDGPSSQKPMEDYSDITYQQPDDHEDRSIDRISDWVLTKKVQSGSFETKSYDFAAPGKDLKASDKADWKFEQSDHKIFDYLGDYTKPSDGDHYAQVRMQEIAQGYEVAQGSGDVRGMVSGSKFTLNGFLRQDQNREYVVLGVWHTIKVDGYEATGSADETLYENTFSVMDSQTQYRAPQITAKPEIRGPQTAIVTGESGEEITTDVHGRVKVKFHWDRHNDADESSSCWIRVSQSTAGKQWGGMFLPRIGQEVIVEHLEGDPDRPIITGRLYNGENKTPYPLPAKKTVSTLKSNSSKGGAGFNEFRFEDLKGEEQVFLHAERNQDIRVKNNRYETIDNDRHLKVGHDKLEEVVRNRNELVKEDHMEEIGKDRHLTVKGKEAKLVDGTLTLTVEGDVSENFSANHSEKVKNDLFLKASNICLEAQSNITLKVGKSIIAISAAGIKIEGPQFEAKGKASAKVESPMTTIKGDGILTVKGGMVKIN
jgi:type VI secretion system secreted protein VgrG